MGLKHDDGWNIPADNPFYPSLPAVYRNVRFQFVFFHADPTAVQDFLPEPSGGSGRRIVRRVRIGGAVLHELWSLPRIFYCDEVPFQGSDRILLFPCLS